VLLALSFVAIVRKRKSPAGAKETPAQQEVRKNAKLLCKIAHCTENRLRFPSDHS